MLGEVLGKCDFVMLGEALGVLDGFKEDNRLGCVLGNELFAKDGLFVSSIAVGPTLGLSLKALEGFDDLFNEGLSDGDFDNNFDGAFEGICVGIEVGEAVGEAVGLKVGAEVGYSRKK